MRFLRTYNSLSKDSSASSVMVVRKEGFRVLIVTLLMQLLAVDGLLAAEGLLETLESVDKVRG